MNERHEVLEVEGLNVRYGKVRALRGVGLRVAAGDIAAVIGSNGAGKSTLLNSIVGVVPTDGGTVHFEGRDVTHIQPWDAVEMGIVQVPEGRQVFPGMTVEANLQAAERKTQRAGLAFGRDDVYDIFPRLADRRRQLAGNLSGGEQQMLAIGRGLVAQPRLLLLDEPTLGLAPILAHQVLEKVVELSRLGLSIVLVEQNAAMALEIAGHAYVLVTGEVHMEGRAQELLSSDAIRQAYLGA